MKIRTLQLAAYGPFTDATIDFSRTAADFHMVFGPNEAGKSSALRALRHMLFGIPAQTTDNFRHPYGDLRIGAGLINADGRRIDFLRRKGRVKTLRAADDETVLDEDALAPFLGGVNQAVFEQMFAIGHEDLVLGGQEIVTGKGRIGEALFAAGAGLIRLQAVQQGLEQDCGTLYKPSGSTPRINQTLTALKEVRKNQKEALLLEKTWQVHDRALREAQERMAAVRQRLAKAKQQTAKLERTRDALVPIARKKEIDAALKTLEGVPALQDDFGEKRRDAEKELKIALRDLERARTTMEKLNGRIAAVPVLAALVRSAASIEGLQHDLGSFRKAQKDRPGLEARMRTLHQQARDRLAQMDRDMRSESASSLKLPPATIGEIRTLAQTYERLATRLDDATTLRRKLATRLNLLVKERYTVAQPVDVTFLEAAVLAAQEAGPIERRLAQMDAAIKLLEIELVRGLQRQHLWTGSPQAIDTLACPSRETIDLFAGRFEEARRKTEKLRESLAAAQDEAARIRVELQTIAHVHQVPTESDLIEARSLRDRGWHLIRRQLAGETPPSEAAEAFTGQFDGSDGLPQAFEKSVKHADRIADRLRREAEQVSRKALLAAREKQIEEVMAVLGDQIATAAADRETLSARWQDIWKPLQIAPLTPAEMTAWLSTVEKLQAKLAELRKIQTEAEATAREKSDLESGLRRALDATGAPPAQTDTPLTGLIREAQARAAAQKELAARIAEMDRDLVHLKGELEEAGVTVAGLEEELAAWGENWRRNMAKIGIDADTGPSAALAVIESLKEARGQIQEAEVLKKRIDGIDRDGAEFKARVEELAGSLAPDLAAEPHDRAAELLNTRLTAARQSDAEYRSLAEQLAAAKKEEADAQKRISRCTAAIEALCAEARCASAEALAEMEGRAQRKKALLGERNDLEQRLRALSAGATVDDFICEAQSVEPDSIGPVLEALAEEIEGLEQERSSLDQTIGTQRAELERMNGNAGAAEHAETGEALLADLESEVEDYARLKIAAVMLSRTIEQYREKHQGPLISRAGELFARMTLGAFDRLRAEYDEKGNPVMVGIRAGGAQSVAVEGMSDGTADQIYLALRLASLEQYLAQNEPLPFVVDDILLRFDDRRALATLEALADLAAQTQVIFFTHHRHLLDLAAAHLGPDRLATHYL